MKKLVQAFVVVSWVFGALNATAMPESFADLIEKNQPAVVNISSTSNGDEDPGDEGDAAPTPDPDQPSPFQGTPFEDMFRDFLENGPHGHMPTKSLGSGVIISPDGYIVTNNHVVMQADDITVRLADERELKAELVGSDPKTDIALIKVDGADLPHAPLGDSDSVRVGDWVVAIGNPFGLGGSVSAGIISALGRNIGQGPYDHFLQTDAAINPGNSGGPLFNTDGQVVGINTAILSRSGGSQGIGFAIPSNTVKLIVDQIKEHGRPIRGWLGVRIQTVTPELADAMKLSDAHGALVAGVVDGSPADKAGLKEGDVIVSYDGHGITKMVDLPRLVAQTEINKRVKMEIVRAGKRLAMSAQITELVEDSGTTSEKTGPAKKMNRTVLGMYLMNLTDNVRAQYGVGTDVKGVLVRYVNGRSAAANAGIRRGDIILQVNRQAVETVTDVTNLVDKGDDKSVLLLIQRGTDSLFVAVRRTGDKDDDKDSKDKG
ncbi:MAG: Do family serine endopeptidase [Proteobacteria bacterium]|nr:Do family serine endopeptidase [Pseudomonadota bacterium]